MLRLLNILERIYTTSEVFEAQPLCFAQLQAPKKAILTFDLFDHIEE